MTSKHFTGRLLGSARARRFVTGILLLSAALLVFGGCSALSSAVGEFSDLSGKIGIDSSGNNLAAQGIKTLENVADASSSPFTPEQEYYIGRSVASTILRSY